MPKEEKTLAMKMLERAHVAYEERRYKVNGEDFDGMAIARSAGLDPTTMFKTIVTTAPDHRLFVFVLPVNCEIDLKRASRAVNEKSLSLVHVADLMRLTGYIRGGCSPIGMKKAYPVTIDESAFVLNKMWISAGRRGVSIGLTPSALRDFTKAHVASITSEGEKDNA